MTPRMDETVTVSLTLVCISALTSRLWRHVLGVLLAHVFADAFCERHEVRRYHQNSCTVVLGSHFCDHLHPSQLDGDGIPCHLLGRFGKLFGGFQFSFRLDDASALFA